MLAEFCPGFSDAGTRSPYRCGPHVFDHLDSKSHAFIVRLSPKTTGRGAPVLLLFGIEMIGTAAAAYYCTERAKALHRKHRSGDFFVAIQVDPRLGFRSLPLQHLDLTRVAFTTPAPPEPDAARKPEAPRKPDAARKPDPPRKAGTAPDDG